MGRSSLAEIPCTVTHKGVLWRKEIASFDDSFNVIGFCSGFSIKMKKLHHTMDRRCQWSGRGSHSPLL